MAGSIEIVAVTFEEGADPRHVVDVNQGGVRRRVVVRVDEVAWLGFAWTSSAEGNVRNIVERYVQIHAADGTLKDDVFIDSDEAADIHWGRK
jgi:hypothetical protein